MTTKPLPCLHACMSLAVPAAATAPAEGAFDTIAGLPVHPLVVHAAVVILPLAAVGLIVIVLVPRWRRHVGWLIIAGLFIGTGAAFVAKESGEALAARVGLPEDHASLGDVLPLVAGALFVIALAWFLLDRRAAAAQQAPGAGVTILGVIAVLAAVGTIALTVAVGHSGAEAVWAGRVSSTEQSSSAQTSASPGTAYTLADVQAHSSPADCWTAIDGTVYDVTSWISEHPGGAERIEQLCGIDGSAAFDDEHGSQREPNQELERLAIGTLSAAGAAAPAAHSVSPAVKRYTRAQVRRHGTATDCWTIIGRSVYDLTDWVNRHPGGASRIIALCGRDGTQAFRAQHGGQSRPASELATFRIGRLATSTTA